MVRCKHWRGALLVAAGLAWAASPAKAIVNAGTPVSGDLFYTTFANINVGLPSTVTPATVDELQFSYDGGTNLMISNLKTLATMPSGQNADGIIFDNSGNLLVGSAGLVANNSILGLSLNGTNQIDRFSQTGTPMGSASTPDGPFHLTLSPDGTTVYSGGTYGSVSTPLGAFNLDGDEPGHLVQTPSDVSAAGTEISTSGTDTKFTQIAFTSGSNVFYTASSDAGTGDYGTINLSTGVTTQLGSAEASAHGVLYDPFSNTVIMTGGDEITQLNPTTGAVISNLVLSSSDQLDQASVDGHGHIFIGNNDGDLVFIDYSKTGIINSSDETLTPFVQTNLDDLAPLNATGAPPVIITTTPPPAVPLPASVWSGMTVLGGLLGISLIRRKKTVVTA